MNLFQTAAKACFLFLSAMLLAVPPGRSAPAAAKDSVEALEVWGKIKGKGSTPLSTDALEKMAVNFGKINNQLCSAAVSGDMDELEYLLRDGASADSVDSLGISALCHAVLGGNKQAVTLLLSAGAHINQKGPFGVTPLMLAANSRQIEMLNLLLLNGADPDLKNDDGETASSIARRKGFGEIENLLQPAAKTAAPENKNPPEKSASQPAAGSLKPPAAAQPSETPPPVPLPPIPLSPETIRTFDQPPPAPATRLDLELMEAAQHGDQERVAELLQNGANPNARLDSGVSPLVRAVERDDYKITQMLLKSGANPDIRAQFNMTPLMMAAQGAQTEIARLLLRAGADPRAKNIVGQSACDIAGASLNEALQKTFDVCSR